MESLYLVPSCSFPTSLDILINIDNVTFWGIKVYEKKHYFNVYALNFYIIPFFTSETTRLTASDYIVVETCAYHLPRCELTTSAPIENAPRS